MPDLNSQKTDRLFSLYKNLSGFEQSFVQLLSVIYEPVNRTFAGNCLQRAGLHGPVGRPLNNSELNRLLEKLQALGLLDMNYRCHDSLIEMMTREAVAAGVYAGMARAVQDELPLSLNSYAKRSQRCWRVMRELRIAVYTHDLPHIENLLPLLSSQCRDLTGGASPIVKICAKPFQSDWFRTLPASLQLYLLNHIFSQALQNFEHFEGPVRYLMKEQGLALIPVEERLPFHRLLANYLLWQGRTKEVLKLMRRNPGSFTASGLAGCVTFLKGNNGRAIENFESDLHSLKKITGRRKIYFHNIAGVFFILALLKSGDQKQFKRIREFIASVQAGRLPEILRPVYSCLHAVMLAHHNEVDEADEILAGIEFENGIAVLFGVLARLWLDGALPGGKPGRDLAARLKVYYGRAVAQDFKWPAMEYAEILGRLTGAAEYSDYADQVRKECRLSTIINAVRLRASWERSLKALINITSSMHGANALDARKKARLVWLVAFADQALTLYPREQKISRRGGWSKGRPVALARLYAGRKLDFLTDQDRQVCEAIRREHFQQKTGYQIDYDRALPALIGHPLLFLAESPLLPVEFVKGEPELMVVEHDNRLLLKFSREITSAGVTAIQETPTLFKIIKVNDKHRRIARIIGLDGLRVPASAADQVMAAIANISSCMTVHSAVAADSAGYQTVDLMEVPADAKIYLQLLPFGTGFKLKMFVKPFGTGGPYIKPGQGVENVMAEIGGRRLSARRDMDLEEENAGRVEKSCPALAACEEVDREWYLVEQEDCLQVLLELNDIRSFITVEWPEGERITVSHQASFSQLAVKVRRRGDWFEVDGRLELDESLVIDMKKLLELSRDNPGRFIPLGDGQFLALTREFQQRLEEVAVFANTSAAGDSSEPVRIHPLAAPALADFVAGIDALEVDEGWLAQLRLLEETRELQPRVPSTLQAELRNYQVEGYVWLARLAHWGVGACLADDMGLGKTLQALAIILERTIDGPTLVVAPTSVCMNWYKEISRFAPTLKIQLFGGRGRKKLVLSLKGFDILISSYTMLQQEARLLASLEWQTIVLDEAQAIKNMATKRSKAAMGLAGRFKLLATGTPIENHLGELWNLFNFINPGLLGSLERFNERFAVPIERHRNPEARRQLKRLISPFILRRMKSQVLEELPSRTEIVLQVEMNKEETAFYEALRRRALKNLEDGKGMAGKNMQILAEIMRLRRACCNIRLVEPASLIPSSKLELFGKVVDELLENRHKVLVFSQFVGHLQLIRESLDKKGMDYRYLDGSTPVRERSRQVDDFQAGRGDLFLISLKAGGLGLNLTAADYVIHMDPWWNPAVEDQASDRAHRIGQKRPVTIYRLVTRNTIEEKIVKLHQEKRELAESLLEGSDFSGRVSMEELLDLIKGN